MPKVRDNSTPKMTLGMCRGAHAIDCRSLPSLNHTKTPDHDEAIKSCSKHKFFTFDYIDTCENIQSLETQLTINHFNFET